MFLKYQKKGYVEKTVLETVDKIGVFFEAKSH